MRALFMETGTVFSLCCDERTLEIYYIFLVLPSTAQQTVRARCEFVVVASRSRTTLLCFGEDIKAVRERAARI